MTNVTWTMPLHNFVRGQEIRINGVSWRVTKASAHHLHVGRPRWFHRAGWHVKEWMRTWDQRFLVRYEDRWED